jgi:hypothetical protein
MMMKKIKGFSLLLVPLVSLFLWSCADAQVQDENTVKVRTVVESEKSDEADIRVFLEGPDGNMVTGAVVIVRNSKNAVLKIPFDPASFCYSESFPIPSDGMLYFSVQSLLSDDIVEYSVPHVPLTSPPVVSVFRDSSGNSALSGQALDADSPVQVAWNALATGVVYQVAVKTALSTLYAESTEANEILIPADSLEAGSGYYLSITAEKIFGDPLFRSASYYSVSAYTGAKMAFSVE